MLRAPAKRKLRMKNALPVLETKMTKCRREVLVFKKLLKKSWSIWVELVSPACVNSLINRRENEGIICMGRPENISMDLDGVPELVAPQPTPVKELESTKSLVSVAILVIKTIKKLHRTM